MKKLRNLRIRTRLGLGFAIVLLLTTLSSGLGIWRLDQVAEETREMMLEPLAKERMAEEWYRLTFAGLKRQLAIIKSADPSLATYFAADAKASSGRIDEIQKYIEAHLSTDAEQELFVAVGKARKLYLANRDAVMLAKRQGREGDVAAWSEQFVPLSENYRAAELKFLNYEKEAVNDLSRAVDATARSSKILIVAFVALAILLGGVFAHSLTFSITQPINAALVLARRVAGGDLTARIRVNSSDEAGQLAQALMDMTDSLVNIVDEVRRDAHAIAAASTRIAAGNQDLSARTERQASSLEETSSSMEELTSTVQQNAGHAREANGLAVSASEIASKGGAVVSRVVGTMGAISASSEKIASIIGVIDSIAFQTNILALNAAVEAARAGEQGRGFAVVATEVRNLAQRSAAAAGEIKRLIGDSVQQVQMGSQLADQAGATMDEIVRGIGRVTEFMNQITSASEEQRSGIEQVNQAILQMDQVTQQNAALVDAAAEAATLLQDQARSLVRAVSLFKLDAVLAAPRGR
jgi:methyl-accepting chemotaxis protein